jgi:PHP family Zn ribbon phosphoesterase
MHRDARCLGTKCCGMAVSNYNYEHHTKVGFTDIQQARLRHKLQHSTVHIHSNVRELVRLVHVNCSSVVHHLISFPFLSPMMGSSERPIFPT